MNEVRRTAAALEVRGLDVYYGMADSRIGVVHLAPTTVVAADLANEFAA